MYLAVLASAFIRVTVLLTVSAALCLVFMLALSVQTVLSLLLGLLSHAWKTISNASHSHWR